MTFCNDRSKNEGDTMTRRFVVTAVRNTTTERGGTITEQVPSFIIENGTFSDALTRARLIVGLNASIDVQDVSTDDVARVGDGIGPRETSDEQDERDAQRDGWTRAGG